MPFVILSLSDRVHDYLRERIVSHEIRPGEAIRQDALALELGVSKIPIREALSRLVESNMVQASTNRGYIAAPLSLDEMEELFELRLLLEPPIAAKTSISADLAQRERVRVASKALLLGADTFEETTKLRRSVILSLLNQPGRPTTMNIVFQVFDRSERYYPPGRARLAGEASALESIVSAWLQGDSDAVAGLYDKTLRSRMEANRATLAS